MCIDLDEDWDAMMADNEAIDWDEYYNEEAYEGVVYDAEDE